MFDGQIDNSFFPDMFPTRLQITVLREIWSLSTVLHDIQQNLFARTSITSTILLLLVLLSKATTLTFPQPLFTTPCMPVLVWWAARKLCFNADASSIDTCLAHTRLPKLDGTLTNVIYHWKNHSGSTIQAARSRTRKRLSRIDSSFSI